MLKKVHPVAVKAANYITLNQNREVMVLLHCLTLLVLPMVKCVIGYIRRDLPLNRMELVLATSQDESSGTTVQAGTAITVHFRR